MTLALEELLTASLGMHVGECDSGLIYNSGEKNPSAVCI